MPGLLSTSVLCAALVCSASPSQTTAQADAQIDAIPAEQVAEVPAPPAPPAMPQGPSDVTLVEFDGAWQFLKMSRRLRVWRPEVGFTMTIDADGQPTDCEIDNRFRKNYINIKLCEVLMDHHTFEPARDAENMAVQGKYHSKLSYAELREEFD